MSLQHILPLSLAIAGLTGCATSLEKPNGRPERRKPQKEVLEETRKTVAGAFKLSKQLAVVPKTPAKPPLALSPSSISRLKSLSPVLLRSSFLAVNIGDQGDEKLLAQAPAVPDKTAQGETKQKKQKKTAEKKKERSKVQKTQQPKPIRSTPDQSPVLTSIRAYTCIGISALVLLTALSLTAYGHFVVEPRRRKRNVELRRRKRNEEDPEYEADDRRAKKRLEIIQKHYQQAVREQFEAADLDYDDYPTAEEEAEAQGDPEKMAEIKRRKTPRSQRED